MDDERAIIVQSGQPIQAFVPQLADRLSKALANAGSLSLDGNNQFHHYQYPTVAQVRGHANKALASAGLGIIPEIVQEGRTTRETDKGKVSNVTFVKLAIHVFAPEGMFTIRWVGESEDMTDKGLAKAVSAGIKSFLLAMMLMPVGEEENDDGEVDAKKAQRKPAPPKREDHGPAWPESPAEPVTPKSASVSWPAEAIDWAVSEWGVKSFAVTGALKQSKILTTNDSVETIKHWLSIRKTERDNGVESMEATARADADLQAIRDSGDSGPNPYRDGAEHA